MQRVWQIVALRVVFTMELPGQPTAVADGLAARLRSWDWWQWLWPPTGQYAVGWVSAGRFCLSCVEHTIRPGRRDKPRRVVAFGTLRAAAGGSTTATVVVRPAWALTLMCWSLLALVAGCLASYPLLLLWEPLGPIFAAGCGGLLLVLPLWFLVSWACWREVLEGRRRIEGLLAECCG